MQKKHLALALLVTLVWGLNFPITSESRMIDASLRWDNPALTRLNTVST